MPRTLLALAAAAALSAAPTARAQLPPYPQSWQLNRSTIIMPCNYSGPTDPQSTVGWSIVDFDWRVRGPRTRTHTHAL